MGPFGIVGVDICADFRVARVFIRIAAHNMNLLLLYGAEESFGYSVVRWPSYPGIAYICPNEGEELFRHPRGVRRAPVCPQFRQYACVRYTLVFQSHSEEVLDMGSIDGGVNVVGDNKTGEEIDEDDKVPADMVDEEFCPVASPHEILLPNAIAWFL